MAAAVAASSAVQMSTMTAEILDEHGTPTETITGLTGPSAVSVDIPSSPTARAHPTAPVHGHHAPPTQPVTINRGHYAIAAISTATIAGLCVANHVMQNDSLGPKNTSDNSTIYLYSLTLVNWLDNLYKGLWRDGASYSHQMGCVVALPLAGVTMDLIAGGIDGNFYFSTTLLTSLTAVPFLVKMIAKAVLGDLSYRGGDQTRVALTETQLSRRRLTVYGLHLALSALVAAGDHTIADGMKPVAFSIFSSAVSKQGKSLIQVYVVRCDKIWALFKLFVLTGSTAVVLGFVFPLKIDASFFDIAYHFGGAPPAIVGSAILTNLLIRAFRAPKEKGPPKIESTKRGITYFAAYTGVTAAASAAYALFDSTLVHSKTLLLGTRLCQLGWGFHLMREVLKSATTNTQKIAIVGLSVVEGYGMQVAANALESAITTQSVSRWDTFIAAAGIGATFVAKRLRERLAPKY